jgi:hypothetical protein
MNDSISGHICEVTTMKIESTWFTCENRLRIRRDARCGGIATIWLVMTIILLFAFMAMAVDINYVALSARQLSNGADAAALAGVAEVRRSRAFARDQAVALAAANVANSDAIQIRRNDINAAAGDVVIGKYSRADATFTPTSPGEGLPNAVSVRALRNDSSLGGPMPTLFASIFGVNSVNVERRAIAMIIGDLGPGVISLDPHAACTLNMRGTSGTFTVENGAVQVNSDHTDAACHSGQPNMDMEEVYVVGGVDNKFEDQVELEGDLYLDADPVPDPLAALPEPNEPGTNFGDVSYSNGDVVTLLPGTYNDLSITGGDVTFAAGLYYFTGELKVNGGNIDATAGVMLFIGPTGNIDVAGNGAFHIVGMDPIVYSDGPGVPAEIAGIKVPIFQSRSNTTTGELNGTADWSIGGTIYVPSAKLLIEGTPGDPSTFANGLIADSIEIRGTADLTIDYTDQFTRIPRRVFLIE